MKEKNTDNSTGKRGLRVALIAAGAAVAVVAAAAAAGTAAVGRTDTIFPKVSVDGVDLGGQTLGEATETLRAQGYGDLGDKSVSVLLPADYTLTVAAEDVCTDTPAHDVAALAWDACHGGSAAQNALTYARCLTAGMELESGASRSVDEAAVRAAVENAAKEVRLALLDSDLSVGEDAITVLKGAQGVEIDTEAVADMIVDALAAGDYTTLRYDAEIEPSTELDVEGLYDTVYAEPSEAYYDAETDEIVPETVGVSFDVDEAERLWAAAGYGDRVYIPLVLTEPEVTKASLEELLFHDRLGSMSTPLTGSNANRVNNVVKAAESVNGIVLMPGEVFSFNEALGERTKEAGYLAASAYVNGKVVDSVGGGICQISSTLYYSALLANLKITSRTCHYFPVTYILSGLDATVSWGGPEFKFMNDRDYPIRILAWVDKDANTANVEIWGTDVDGSYVEMSYTTAYWYDSTWKDVALGYRVQTYRSVYAADGSLLSRTPEASSLYHYHEESIRWPAEALATPEPEATEPSAETEPPAASEAPAESPVLTDSLAPTEIPAETEAPIETEIPAETETPEPSPEPGEPVGE